MPNSLPISNFIFARLAEKETEAHRDNRVLSLLGAKCGGQGLKPGLLIAHCIKKMLEITSGEAKGFESQTCLDLR